MIICEFTVSSRPVPWSAPTVPRRGHPYKDRRLEEWQRRVADEAWLAMRGRPPFPGPVALAVHFGICGGQVPDLCNLVKAVEDAMQEIVYVNDRQVCRHNTGRTVGDWDGAVIRVSELEG